VLASHPRCYGREQDILNPLHYLLLLEQRPGAWDQAKPIQQWKQTWPAVYDRYLAALRERLPEAQATREFVQILRLHADHPEPIIAQALEQALVWHCYTAAGVKQLVLRLVEPAQPTSQLELPFVLNTPPVNWPEMEQFNRLLSLAGGGS
jgi:hypothetical protein